MDDTTQDNVIRGKFSVDPPCDTEPREGYATEDDFSKAIDNPYKHATDGNPNKVSSNPFPWVNVFHLHDKVGSRCVVRVQSDHTTYVDIPITSRKRLEMIEALARFHRSNDAD